MLQLNVLDYVIIALAVIGAIRGAMLGLSCQLFTLLSLAVSVAVAVVYQPRLVAHMAGVDGTTSDSLMRLAAYVLLFVGTLVVFWLLRGVGRRLFRFSFTPWLERVGGAALGLLSSALMLMAAVLALSLVPIAPLRQAVAEESWVGRQITSKFPRLYRELAEQHAWPPWPVTGGEGNPPAASRAEPVAPTNQAGAASGAGH
jgi:uncharacterized membrane protein required for colicin V production